MEIPNHLKSEDLRLLDISFKELLHKKKPKEIKTWLSFIGTFNRNINKKQLKIIYDFQNSKSRLVREGLVNAIIYCFSGFCFPLLRLFLNTKS